MKFFQKIKNLFQDGENKNLLVNIIGAFVIKGLSLIISFFSMPLYIKYFDNYSILGIWYTILSVLSWISICDLGLGNGLRNKFTEAYTLGKDIEAKKYISSTYISLIIVILPIAIIIGNVISYCDVNSFLGIEENILDSRILKKVVLILLLGILLNFVLKIISYIIYAIQKSSVNNFIGLVSNIIPLVYIVFSNKGTLLENLVNLAIIHIIAINLPLLIVTFIIFRSEKLKFFRPSLKYVDLFTAKEMLRTGLQFFLAQIFFIGLISTNEILIAKFFNPENVVEYSIYYRVFTLIGSLFMLALTPLWSKVTKDFAEKKYKLIKKMNKLLYIIALVAILSNFLVIPILQFLIDFWLQDKKIIIDLFTSTIFALFGGLYILNIVLTTIANGIGKLETQILIYGVGMIFKVPLVLFFKKIFNDWSVVVAYNCLILGIFCIIQIVWIEKNINKLINSSNLKCKKE